MGPPDAIRRVWGPRRRQGPLAGGERGQALQGWYNFGRRARNIFTAAEAHEKLSYMHDNPVRKGLVEVAADWP